MRDAASLRLTCDLNAYITSFAPRVVYTPEQLESALRSYTEEEKQTLRDAGWLGDDFECFYAVNRFLNETGAAERAGDIWLRQVYSEAKRLDAVAFRRDPYLSRIRVPEKRIGRFQLKQVSYLPGEFLQYDMPDLSRPHVTPKLGFFTERVTFPAVYEGNMPWVSVCPSEVNSMLPDTVPAHGKVLVLGLGLGYYPYILSLKEDVESIVIVELQKEIIDLFSAYILPQFEHREKLTVVQADAFSYLETVRDDDFDFCYADIWEGEKDGAEAYRRILPHEKRLSGTAFAYWIKDAIQRRAEEENGGQ